MGTDGIAGAMPLDCCPALYPLTAQLPLYKFFRCTLVGVINIAYRGCQPVSCNSDIADTVPDYLFRLQEPA